MICTTLRRLCGQRSTGPTGVADQSLARTKAPNSPPPARNAVALLFLVAGWSTHAPQYIPKHMLAVRFGPTPSLNRVTSVSSSGRLQPRQSSAARGTGFADADFADVGGATSARPLISAPASGARRA